MVCMRVIAPFVTIRSNWYSFCIFLLDYAVIESAKDAPLRKQNNNIEYVHGNKISLVLIATL